MTRFRQLILSLAIALALLVPLGTIASADPGDGGGFGLFGGGGDDSGGEGDPGGGDGWILWIDPGDGGGF